MLERFLELQPAVYAALMSKEIRSKEKDVTTLTDADVTLAENVMSVLIPLRTVSTGLCKESCPTASLILPLQKKLLEQALTFNDTDTPAIRQLKQTIADDLKPRYSSASVKMFLEEVALLDPRCKTSYLSDAHGLLVSNRVISSAASLVPSVVDDPSPDSSQQKVTVLADPSEGKQISSTAGGLASFLSDFMAVQPSKPTNAVPSGLQRAIEEMFQYLKCDLLGLELDPLIWWREHEGSLPLLAMLARKYLCVPATSVPSERVFSTAGDILSAQRASLDSDKVDTLIFLKKNMK